jgi:hypothetical protein
MLQFQVVEYMRCMRICSVHCLCRVLHGAESIEMIEGLRYKLCMMGIPIDGPTSVFCDNAAVVRNSTVPESVLKKKHNAIAYHRAREAVAAGTIRIAKEDGETNLSNLLMKYVPGQRLRDPAGRVLW